MVYVKGSGYMRFGSDSTPCVLCGKPGGPTDYYMMGGEHEGEAREANLCGPHKGVYMRLGIRRLSEIMGDDMTLWQKKDGIRAGSSEV